MRRDPLLAVSTCHPPPWHLLLSHLQRPTGHSHRFVPRPTIAPACLCARRMWRTPSTTLWAVSWTPPQRACRPTSARAAWQRWVRCHASQPARPAQRQCNTPPPACCMHAQLGAASTKRGPQDAHHTCCAAQEINSEFMKAVQGTGDIAVMMAQVLAPHQMSAVAAAAATPASQPAHMSRQGSCPAHPRWQRQPWPPQRDLSGRSCCCLLATGHGGPAGSCRAGAARDLRRTPAH